MDAALEATLAGIANRGRRLLAAALDLSLVSIACCCRPFGAPEGEYAFAVWVAPFLLFLLGQAALIALTGQSVGKRALSLRIVHADGSHPGAARLLLRELMRFGLCGVPTLGGLLTLADHAGILGGRRDLDRDGVFVIDVGTHDRYVESPAREAQ